MQGLTAQAEIRMFRLSQAKGECAALSKRDIAADHLIAARALRGVRERCRGSPRPCPPRTRSGVQERSFGEGITGHASFADKVSEA